MSSRTEKPGFTLLELVISLALVTLLLAILLPALTSARTASRREQCATNQRQLGDGWFLYLESHDGAFPYVPTNGGWRWGGVQFSSLDGHAFADLHRPLTSYVSSHGAGGLGIFQCPADRGIRGDTSGVGTGGRTAYAAFGTSYRANHRLLDASLNGVEDEFRGLHLNEIATIPRRMVLLGGPIWHEVYESTGRDAAWHGEPDMGNLLFLDGSVQYMEIWAKHRIGPAVYEPRLWETTRATIRGEPLLPRKD